MLLDWKNTTKNIDFEKLNSGNFIKAIIAKSSIY